MADQNAKFEELLAAPIVKTKSRLRVYEGTVVAKGCQLDIALENRNFTAAAAIHREALAEYHKHVPRDFDYRSSFQRQDEQDDVDDTDDRRPCSTP